MTPRLAASLVLGATSCLVLALFLSGALDRGLGGLLNGW